MEVSDRHLAPTALSRERTQVSFEYEAEFAPSHRSDVAEKKRMFFPLAGIEP